MIPPRISLAVELLDPQPADALLEIGCGRGVAAALILPRLATGSLIAIDRSSAAVAAAALANRSAVEAGRATFLESAFEDLDPRKGPFDRVLAVNVNRFWLRPVDERKAWSSLLKKGARVVLVFDSPGGSLQRQVDGARAYLDRNGFAIPKVTPSGGGGGAVGIAAEWPATTDGR